MRMAMMQRYCLGWGTRALCEGCEEPRFSGGLGAAGVDKPRDETANLDDDQIEEEEKEKSFSSRGKAWKSAWA